MKTRTLGSQRLNVSEIGLGCMGMDHACGQPADRREMVQLIREAVEMGCNFFDTAVIHSPAAFRNVIKPDGGI